MWNVVGIDNERRRNTTEERITLSSASSQHRIMIANTTMHRLTGNWNWNECAHAAFVAQHRNKITVSHARYYPRKSSRAHDSISVSISYTSPKHSIHTHARTDFRRGTMINTNSAREHALSMRSYRRHTCACVLYISSVWPMCVARQRR